MKTGIGIEEALGRAKAVLRESAGSKKRGLAIWDDMKVVEGTVHPRGALKQIDRQNSENQRKRVGTALRWLIRAVEAQRSAEHDRRSKAGRAVVRKHGKGFMREIAKKGGWPKGRLRGPRKPKEDKSLNLKVPDGRGWAAQRPPGRLRTTPGPAPPPRPLASPPQDGPRGTRKPKGGTDA